MNSWNLLLVDEDEEFVSTLADRLELRGIRARTVLNIEQAFHEIRQFRPDAIVLSLAFQEMAGFDMVRDLIKSCPQIGLVTLVDIGKIMDKQQSHRLGITHCLMKPFQMDELIGALEDTIQKATK